MGNETKATGNIIIDVAISKTTAIIENTIFKIVLI